MLFAAFVHDLDQNSPNNNQKNKQKQQKNVQAADRVLQAQFLGFPLGELLKWGLTTPVQFVIGWRFHRGAYKALRRGAANMDVLVSLGTNASYFYSVISILHHHFTRHHPHHFGASARYVPTDFFETAAMLVSVVLFGKYLECAAKGRTSAASQALLASVDRDALAGWGAVVHVITAEGVTTRELKARQD